MTRASRPKVMQVITHLDLGGAEQVAISLAEQLHAEYDFCFFAALGVAQNPVGESMLARLRALNVPVQVGTTLDMKRGGAVQAALKLSGAWRRLRPDLLHLHTEIPETTYALSAALTGRAGGPRVIRTIHNTTLWPAWQRIGRWVERRVSGAAVVAVSHGGLRGLESFRAQHGLAPLDGAQCRVVYNGVAVPPPRLSRRLAGATRVLFAGRFEPQKGADLLPAILERASQLSGQGAEVTVLGSGSLEVFLQRWAREQRTGWSVTVSSPVPNLPRFMGEYDVVLMPSRFEGLALVAVESLLAGTPVVGTRVPGMSEVFPAGYPLLAPNENVAKLAELLAQVVDDPQGHAERAAALRGPLETKFGLEAMGRGYHAAYQDVLARPGGAGMRRFT